MKYSLPPDHGLSQFITDNLIFCSDGIPSLTDIQYEALAAGVGRGESALVIAPTSTGKTQIAVWSIAQGVQMGARAVYLVTHRALAEQKFEEMRALLLGSLLENDGRSIVLATGDHVHDSSGFSPPAPLLAPIVVATYEKYLAMLSASGVPADLRSTVVVCDEVQLIGDKYRGQSVEVLLTLLRNAAWRQLVALSAVIESRDARELASWLGLRLVEKRSREKHLTYECWAPQGIVRVTTRKPDTIESPQPLPPGCTLNPLSLVQSLARLPQPPLPIIVFCTRSKKQISDLARKMITECQARKPGQLPTALDELPLTSAASLLSQGLANRIAIHNADLTDEERALVESLISKGEVDIVFASPTLAAGVNFSFGAGVFASWDRWSQELRTYVPIETSEFHNMAGRVGRMGFGHTEGTVYFVAGGPGDFFKARKYLDLAALTELQSRITPISFPQLSLQLVAAKLCGSRDSLQRVICTTFSGMREQDRNLTAYNAWPAKLSAAVDQLVNAGFLLEGASGDLAATPVGKEIANSGLRPETGVFALEYIATKGSRLTQLLPRQDSEGNLSRLNFLLCALCFSSPEFRPRDGRDPTRSLPWQILSEYLVDGDPYRDDLPDPVWQTYPAHINAAKLTLDWIDGAELGDLESNSNGTSAGMLLEMFRNVSWALQGISSIIRAASDIAVPDMCRPSAFRDSTGSVSHIRKLPRIARRLAFRISHGLPDDVLWMLSLNSPGEPYRLSRTEALRFRASGFSRPEQLMLGSKESDAIRSEVFANARPSPFAKANWLRDSVRNWKTNDRKRAAAKQVMRADRLGKAELFQQYYGSIGSHFEKAFENLLADLGVEFTKLDDSSVAGAPDYLISFPDLPGIVMELKSREGDRLIDYNKAVEVLSASEIYGYREAPCVTLCHPGVDPSVPNVILSCGRLTVVESTDLAEALLRVSEGYLTKRQLYSWLVSPGQALAADLPFAEHGSVSRQ